MKTTIFALCSFIAFAAASDMALSKTNQAAVHGFVTDPSGAVIAGAMVTVSTPHWTRTVSTDESGEYRIAGIDANADRHCKVSIRYGGFTPFEKATFVLTPGMETEANAELEVHAIQQTITVYE